MSGKYLSIETSWPEVKVGRFAWSVPPTADLYKEYGVVTFRLFEGRSIYFHVEVSETELDDAIEQIERLLGEMKEARGR